VGWRLRCSAGQSGQNTDTGGEHSNFPPTTSVHPGSDGGVGDRQVPDRYEDHPFRPGCLSTNARYRQRDRRRRGVSGLSIHERPVPSPVPWVERTETRRHRPGKSRTLARGLFERRRRDLNPWIPYGVSTLAGWCVRPDNATSPCACQCLQ